MKVLYADDDIQVRDYVSMLLEAGLDCEILEASSGNEALAILEFDQEIDFVITEVKMKGGNGNVIVDYLDSHSLDIPIVWLSDKSNREAMSVQEVLSRSDLNTFLDKPFRDDQFFPVIERILDLKSRRLNSNNEEEEVIFDDEDFDFDEGESEVEILKVNDKKSNPQEQRDMAKSLGEEDWSYGARKQDKGSEETLDYSLKPEFKRKEAEEAGYSLKKEFNPKEEEDAGYSLKNEFEHSEEDADYSLKNEFEHSEEDAGYSLKNEFEHSEEDAGYSLKKEFEHSEEDAGYSLKKEFEHREEDADYSLKKESEPENKTQDNTNSTSTSEDKSSDTDYDRSRFKRIKIKRLLNFNVICCDVFIKINSNKYLKIINIGEEYNQDNLERYIKKGTKFLYIEKPQYQKFCEQFSDLVSQNLEKAQAYSPEIKSIAELAAFENTLEMAKEFGVTQATANKVKQSIKSNIESLSSMPKFEDLLKRIMRGGDYISEHSLLLSYVAGQICLATSWGSSQTLEKLSMAALFHDIGLTNNEWARFHTIEDAKIAGLSESEIEILKSHPAQAAELLVAGEHIFADVDSIIVQHHELPDETGYPRGLGALSISPLSCIFIIASEFVEEIYDRDPSTIDRESIKAKIADRFSRGNFKKPLSAFLKVF